MSKLAAKLLSIGGTALQAGLLLTVSGCIEVDTPATNPNNKVSGTAATATESPKAAPEANAEQFKLIAKAFADFHRAHQRFPSASSNATGLSWRVQLLPFLDQQALFDQFKHEQSWDSPDNLKLVDKMPDVFRLPGVTENKTVYHVFVGEGTPFGGEEGPTYGNIKDGSDNTIMVVAGSLETAAEWTKPGGIMFDPANPFHDVPKVDGGYPILSMAGFTWLIIADSPQEAAKWVTHSGSETISSGVRKAWGR